MGLVPIISITYMYTNMPFGQHGHRNSIPYSLIIMIIHIYINIGWLSIWYYRYLWTIQFYWIFIYLYTHYVQDNQTGGFSSQLRLACTCQTWLCSTPFSSKGPSGFWNMGKHWCGMPGSWPRWRLGWLCEGKQAQICQRHHRMCGFFADVKVTPCCIFRFKPATEIWTSALPKELRPMLIPNWLRIPHSRWLQLNSGCMWIFTIFTLNLLGGNKN